MNEIALFAFLYYMYFFVFTQGVLYIKVIKNYKELEQKKILLNYEVSKTVLWIYGIFLWIISIAVLVAPFIASLKVGLLNIMILSPFGLLIYLLPLSSIKRIDGFNTISWYRIMSNVKFNNFFITLFYSPKHSFIIALILFAIFFLTSFPLSSLIYW
jgi:hypothetical protein